MQGAGGQVLGLEPRWLGAGRLGCLLRLRAGMTGITGGRRSRYLTQAGLCARRRLVCKAQVCMNAKQAAMESG